MRVEHLKSNHSMFIKLGESKKLYIGDPSYVIGRHEVNEQDDWCAVSDNIRPENYWDDVTSEKRPHDIIGAKISFHSDVSELDINLIIADTFMGDGYFHAETAKNLNFKGSKVLSVDSGDLGCVAWESIHPRFYQEALECGMVLTLETDDPIEYIVVEDMSQDKFTHQISQNGKVLVSIETCF